MNINNEWFKIQFGRPIRYMEIVEYVYLCSKCSFKIESVSLPLYCHNGVELLYYDNGNVIDWIPLSDLDKIDTVALKSPIYLTKRNDDAVFEHWKRIIELSKNDYLKKIKRLDSYLETLES